MKLIRYGELNKENTGVAIDGTLYDTSAFGEEYNEQFFETDGLSRLKDFVELNKERLERIPENSRLGSPFARPSKIVCTGLNYADHAEEMGKPIPTEPIIFMKSTTALIGPNDDIIIPKIQRKQTGKWSWLL
jgi:2,4-didehydro-3-deoxy-L-rhamnonate hydrolase